MGSIKGIVIVLGGDVVVSGVQVVVISDVMLKLCLVMICVDGMFLLFYLIFGNYEIMFIFVDGLVCKINIMVLLE